MTNKQAIEVLTLELWHTESHKKIEGKATEYYEELSQIAEALKMAIEALRKMDLIRFNIYALNDLLKKADNDKTN